MIKKNDFEKVIDDVKVKYPKLTVLGQSIEEEDGGALWLAYTFSEDKAEIEEMKEGIEDGIPEGAHDILFINCEDSEPEDLREEWIEFIEED